MKNIFMVLTLLLYVNTGVLGQSETKLSKKEKKELAKNQKNQKRKEIHELLDSKFWILKIESIQSLSGQIIPLAPEANFIISEKDLITLELPAQEFILMGETDYTGISSSGDITIYSLDEFKENQLIYCSIQCITNEISWIKMKMEINSDGIATVHCTLSDGLVFTLSGTIESQE